jgi:hypothetical protein
VSAALRSPRTTTWDEVLDAYAARLDAQLAALAAGRPAEVEPFAPPPGLPPLPAALRARAEELLAQSVALEGVIGGRMGELLARREASQAKRRPTSTPKYLDARC